MEQCNEIDLQQVPDYIEQEESKEDDKQVETKKPLKTTRKQRINKIIYSINNDNIENIMNDIINENKRLHKEIETLRIQNTGLKREYEELIHAILKDRLENQQIKTLF